MGKEIRAMVVSVGGTPAPVIFSLNKKQPEFVCFFVSRQTKRMLEDEILPRLTFKPRHYDWITTPNAESLSECYQEISRRLPDLVEKWDVEPRDVCVDYTGGTKTMSVALALATIEQSCCYSYVGGDERSKGGVGIVVNGKEKMWFLDNPWDEIAHGQIQEVCLLFNKARYASAAEVLEKCLVMVSKERKPFLRALFELVTGFDLWDRFKHGQAKKHLYRSEEILMSLGAEKPKIRSVAKQLEDNIEFLERVLEGGKPSVLHFYDLMANARRRAELERKFDDAVARVYRAMELLAQVELKVTFGVDTSNVNTEAIPEGLMREYTRKYRDERDGKIKIGLYASYSLLKELGAELGRNFFSVYEKELRPVLDIRNSSILAHGMTPVDENTFQRLFRAVLDFTQTKEDLLPRFPALDL